MDLIKACKQLVVKDPFYGLFLLSLNKYYSKDDATAWVARNGINYELCVNPDFWNTLTDDEQLGVLKHELLHIAFKHLLMQESFNDKKVFNIAADAEVNQYIDVLPKDAIDIKNHIIWDALGRTEVLNIFQFNDGAAIEQRVER